MRLEAKAGSRAGMRFRLTGELITLGRGLNNACVFADHDVSRQHATLRRREDSWVLADLDSLNGTYVNDEPVKGPTVVGPGDEIRLGSTVVLQLVGEPEPYKAAATPLAPGPEKGPAEREQRRLPLHTTRYTLTVGESRVLASLLTRFTQALAGVAEGGIDPTYTAREREKIAAGALAIMAQEGGRPEQAHASRVSLSLAVAESVETLSAIGAIPKRKTPSRR